MCNEMLEQRLLMKGYVILNLGACDGHNEKSRIIPR